MTPVDASGHIIAESTPEADKLKGNQFFKDRHYEKAIHAYTNAINKEEKPVYYCNRAFANYHLEYYGQAISDTNSAILLDDKFYKAYYRRGCSFVQLLKYSEAVKDFKLVYTNTKDPNAKKHLLECEKIIKQRKFEAAIRVEEKNVFDDEGWKEMHSDDSGPSFDSEFTLEFAKECAEYMKSKTLGRKLVLKILFQCYNAFKIMESVVDITVPKDIGTLTICGDTHGQYFDVLNIFNQFGWPSQNHYYLFNGDFVDRGSWSIEVIMLLLLLKCALPNSLYLTRGNHETNGLVCSCRYE